MKINFAEKLIGSGFYTGYIPFASGTWGSAAALLIYWLPGFENIYIMTAAIILFGAAGVYIGNKFEKLYGKDPAECTVDEVVGMWISLLFLPKILWISLMAFIVWRIFDIIKPYPAGRLENLPGGMGIMADDAAASIYALGVVHLILAIFR